MGRVKTVFTFGILSLILSYLVTYNFNLDKLYHTGYKEDSLQNADQSDNERHINAANRIQLRKDLLEEYQNGNKSYAYTNIMPRKSIYGVEYRNSSKTSMLNNWYKPKVYPVVKRTILENLINWTNPKHPISNVTYLIENPELCSSVQMLDVVIVVNSAPDHFERRQSMRETWTNDSYYSHLATVRTVFLLGRTSDLEVQFKIEEEFQNYQDILQGDFVDTYYNITHKGVMGFRWLTERCRNAQIILKMDDDWIVNMFVYLKQIRELVSNRSINVYCHYITGLIQRNGTKWLLSYDHFRGKVKYERYCRGIFVSMTNDIIPSLYKAAVQAPFFPFDDVLLYGYVMHNVPSLKYQTLKDKDMALKNFVAMSCFKKSMSKCSKFVISATGMKEKKETWKLIMKHFGNT